MFTKEEIENAIQTQKFLVKENAFLNTPAWDSFIAHLNYEFHNDSYPPISEDEHHNPDDTIINGVNIRERFYLMNAAADNPKFFPECFPILEKLKSIMPTEYFGSGTFINFVGKEKPINVHNDPRHSFYWQTHGSSIWEVYKDGISKTPIYSKEILKGDIAFVPHGLWHSVVTPEPRSAISFMFKL